MVEQPAVEVAKVAEEAKPGIYELHIKVPREMQDKLKKAAILANKLGLTPKPELAELMDLFLGWGLNTLHNAYLQRMGFKSKAVTGA